MLIAQDAQIFESTRNSVSPSNRYCKSNRKAAQRFDSREAQDSFMRGLRDSERKFTTNQTKNPFQQIWSTDPTRRIDRPLKRLREVSLLNRSGFNKLIDSNDSRVIDKPIQ